MAKIRITCKGADTVKYTELIDFQGNLKERTEEDIYRIKKSIEKYGFSFPFFVWEHKEIKYCLDGHGRLQALKKMSEEGWSIPALPITYIQAKNVSEAKNKLLRLNSQYGQITPAGFIEFTKDLEFDFSEIELNIPNADLSEGFKKINDVFQEYDVMPEFDTEGDNTYHKIIVHFIKEKDMHDFSNLIGQDINEKTKFIHFPETIRRDLNAYRFVDDD